MRTVTFNRVLSVGAMGTVYHAEVRGPRQAPLVCAVRMLSSEASEHVYLRSRVHDEAKLLKMLQDERMLGVVEVVRINDADAVIMRFDEGVALPGLRSEVEIPARALAHLGKELADILHRAHIATHPGSGQPLKVVHRDVNPRNCMLTESGGVRLLNFGLARAVFDTRATQTEGLVFGSLDYVPPEALAGQEPTAFFDVFGLGLTLWEAATGEGWGAPTAKASALQQRLDDRLAELPEGFESFADVLREMLAYDPRERPTAEHVSQRLAEVAEACDGASLRAFCRMAVPPLLEQPSPDDPLSLVGRTLAVDGPAPLPVAQAKTEARRVAGNVPMSLSGPDDVSLAQPIPAAGSAATTMMNRHPNAPDEVKPVPAPASASAPRPQETGPALFLVGAAFGAGVLTLMAMALGLVVVGWLLFA
ncbi:MAG: protein kinase [Myxococcales bacterium]|nr:protein kinase [Myxococcales bacterium]